MAFTLDALQQVRLKNMAKVFSLLPGDKVLLVDSSLLSALDRVTNMAVLRKLSITKLFKIDNLPPKGDFPRIAYLLPSTYASVMLISKHCKVDETNGIQRTRLVVFVPKETPDVRYVLESKGLYGRNMCTESLSLGWIPIDSDLVSLNLPTLFADFYLNGDYTWPQFMGLEVGELLEVAHESELAPMGCRVHAFGEAAEAVASGIRLHCIQSGLVTTPYASVQTGPRAPHVKLMDSANAVSQSSMCSVNPTNVLQPPPLVIIFSRDWDYVTPMLMPMTFEALIHEVIGIELGVVELPESVCSDKGLRKYVLHSDNLFCYKEVRNLHISRVHTMLESWRNSLQDTRSGLELQLATRRPSTDTLSTTTSNSNNYVADLKQLGSQVGPLIAKRRELLFLLLVLEHILHTMTECERIEDLRAAQTILLRSGSGESLAMVTGTVPSQSDEDQNNPSKSVPPAAGGPCGTAADDLSSMPLRLAMEWISTHHGDRLIDGIRMAALACVTHDGLADEAYSIIHRAVLHAVGQTAYPMLYALRCLRILGPRGRFERPSLSGTVTTTASDDDSGGGSGDVKNASSRNLSAKVARLGLTQRRKSVYNRLHHLLHLSHHCQTNRRIDQSPVSPSYVYAGQHCPVVVRLTEVVWASSLLDSSMAKQPNNSAESSRTGMAHSVDTELIHRKQLVSALKLLGLPETASSSLGLVNFTDPSLAAAGYQHDAFELRGRLAAPAARPLPLMSVNQPVLVVFPGGCTYGEVAALRFAAARRRWNLLIATSCLLTSRDLLQQAGQDALNCDSS
ncbi:hypothetical protein PHET_02603 [Paragonimus heterotremus]|uniref:Vacuolar protein sorting-associated protein 33B n=1 Tax=Paragonimus heterotremus TaxID=100268 RepID=A0A8J4TPY3_9TREM|nr:hypothetical protein PHET_02603 [Paragonimus heterotremus]